jgi:hypothetical protein
VTLLLGATPIELWKKVRGRMCMWRTIRGPDQELLETQPALSSGTNVGGAMLMCVLRTYVTATGRGGMYSPASWPHHIGKGRNLLP